MKKFLLIPLCIILCSAARSSEISISLHGQNLTYARELYYLEDLYLAQQEDSCLGYVNSGRDGFYTPVFFDHLILAELKSFLRSALPENPEKKPVILRVNRIYLFENRFTGDAGIHLQLNLTFIFREGESFNEDYTAVYSTRIRFTDFPGSLPKLIARSFDVCFKQYDEKLKEGKVVPRKISVEQLRVNPLEAPMLFCYPDTVNLKRGIYSSYLDFRDGLLDTNAQFTVHFNNNKKEPRLTECHIRGKEKNQYEKVWGFSDGKTIYVNTGKYFTPLSREENKFTLFLPSYEFGKNITSAAIFGGVLFGVAGAILFGNLAGVGSDPNAVQKCQLDPYDGKFLPFGLNNYTFLSTTVVFAMSKISVEGTGIKIIIDGRELCELTPGKYFLLDLSCRYSKISIRLVSSNGGVYEEDLPLEHFRTYLCLIKVKKNYKISVDHPFDQVKKDILEKRNKENTNCSVDLFKTDGGKVLVN